MPGRDIIQRLLALTYQRSRRLGSLKCFQSRLAFSADTDVFLWPILGFNFMSAG
jgi:hypothetical protein